MLFIRHHFHLLNTKQVKELEKKSVYICDVYLRED